MKNYFTVMNNISGFNGTEKQNNYSISLLLIIFKILIIKTTVSLDRF
jgi:hypothetical protein